MYYCINNYESDKGQSLKDFCLEIAKHELEMQELIEEGAGEEEVRSVPYYQ